MADTKRAAAHRRQGPERGVAAYTPTPEREQTVLIGWPSDIGKKVFIVHLEITCNLLLCVQLGMSCGHHAVHDVIC